MTSADPLPPTVLNRKAVVYVRQSTQTQVQVHLESQRRQYDLVDEARRHGFHNVDVIDDDLGRSASGTVARPGFEKLVAGLCAGEVGAVLCFDASRLARNGRDWHHLLELCGLVDARVIDLDGVYNPCRPNDRLLLGMKGSISEFELGVLRSRMLDAARSKARRGELRISVPIGFVWHREIGLGLDPDCRVQEVTRGIFQRFRELGSARQVHLALKAEQVHFPRPSDGKRMTTFDWTPIRYRNVISVLKNPFYAGAYAYGKSVNRTQIVDGRARKTYGHYRPLRDCEILLKDHHVGYIDWEEFERNQAQLATNAYGRRDGAKSGRGGRALLGGLLVCRRCGRRLGVVYTGRSNSPVYRCDRGNTALGVPRCMMFGGLHVDAAFARELIRAVEPMAIEAAQLAEQRKMERQAEHHRLLELELQQARYEASLAGRRYAACVPEAIAGIYRGKAYDLHTIRRDHNVHFAIEGSVRRENGHLIVAATVFDTNDDRPVWSHVFRKDDTQADHDLILYGITDGFDQSSTDTEVAYALRTRPNNLDKRDLLFAGSTSALARQTKDHLVKRLDYVNRALALDPNYGAALRIKALTLANLVINGFSTDYKEDAAEAMRIINQELETAPTDYNALAIKTRVLRAQGDLKGAKALIHQLLQINPLSGFRYFDLGMISIYQGDHKSALSNMQRAKQLAFRGDDFAAIDNFIAMMLMATGQYADAVPQARVAAGEMAADFGRLAEFPWLTLIAAEALGGQLYDARVDLGRFLATPRELSTLRAVRRLNVLRAVPPLLEGLRLAGMSE